jgi:hypothetical protein
MYNKRAVSGVITTLLLITVAIVAIGIVAMVILDAVDSGREAIDYNQKCLGSQFKINSVAFDNQGTISEAGPPVVDGTGDDRCDVVIERLSSLYAEEIDGMIITLNNDEALRLTTEDNVISTATLEVECTTDAISETADITRVDGVAYFTKEDNSKHQCTAFSWEAS